ncbi:Asp-tRNA(Asn)/Glu-tRNA(Gln) amidotransferase subunit GatA [Botrimarina hoheduenensis]|uniref:Glutamyl-tRNA(Gln) amidotransferase subunit A n=1 Tax=Botrimarina hoheduenensis TaxID=2528000 RepID=A0A5C5VY40_9BACT|nr:Asp-tRNA(Asn)/Glu-tRNA(Gln) amidotransferase subunit GatA [Botrimarina hoheduenensis]TWT42925.1 Glutamyl-tRNA(Gln) amidotransferase subunit A [Botrimarina hoheduenensis]
MADSLAELTAVEQLRLLNAGQTTSVALTTACLDRIAATDQRVGAFLRTTPERALAQAADIDRRRAAGDAVGALGGVPVAVKDVLCDEGQLTTCASKMLADFRPPYDATVVERLKQADAVLVGRTNMDEFAMGGSTENSAFQKTRNPWDLERSPGGSSGGAAACVAAGQTALSIGTDTGGSIRQPAALCGVVGLKPTYGRVSRYGLVAFASSLDQVGPLGRTVSDVALLYDAIAGHDPHDTTSAKAAAEPTLPQVNEPLKGLRVGVVPEHFAAGLSESVRQAVERAIDSYRQAGAQIVEVALPHARHAVATYYVIAPCEASSNLARYDGVHYGRRTDPAAMHARLAAERKSAAEANDATAARQIDTALVRLYRQSRSEALGPEVQRRIMLGAYALSAGYYDAYYLKALKVRRLIRQDFDAAFEQVDVIAGPVTASPAFKLGELIDDPLAMYLVDLYTVSANLAGLPAISLPCGLSPDGLPIGLHLMAPPLKESRLLRAARMFEASRDPLPLPRLD